MPWARQHSRVAGGEAGRPVRLPAEASRRCDRDSGRHGSRPLSDADRSSPATSATAAPLDALGRGARRLIKAARVVTPRNRRQNST